MAELQLRVRTGWQISIVVIASGICLARQLYAYLIQLRQRILVKMPYSIQALRHRVYCFQLNWLQVPFENKSNSGTQNRIEAQRSLRL